MNHETEMNRDALRRHRLEERDRLQRTMAESLEPELTPEAANDPEERPRLRGRLGIRG